MNRLEITRHTTDAAIIRFCDENPQFSRKVIMAQAKHERRIKRIAHRRATELNGVIRDIGQSNASVNEYWQRVGGHPPPEQQDQ
jgi:hypothetical protein